jgi:hypothetical protein
MRPRWSTAKWQQRETEGWMLQVLRLKRPIDAAAFRDYLRRAALPIPEALRLYAADRHERAPTRGRTGSGPRALTESAMWLRNFVYREFDGYFASTAQGRSTGKRYLAFQNMADDLAAKAGVTVSVATLQKIWNEAPADVKARYQQVREDEIGIH